MACVLENKILRPQQIIWQTPSLYEYWSVIKDCGIPGLSIIGTLDRHYQTAISYFSEDRIVIDGADHAMEIPGNLLDSITILQRIVKKTDDWLMRASV